MDTLSARFEAARESLSIWLASPSFYFQLGATVAAIVLALLIATLMRSRFAALRTEPDAGPWMDSRRLLFRARGLLFPLFSVLLLGIAVGIGEAVIGKSWLIIIAQSLAVVFLLYAAVTRLVDSAFIANLLKWVGIPLATLRVFGWLDDVTRYLGSISLQVGNIEVSAWTIGRTLFFGSILFWLGRISNSTGKRAIRNYPNLDAGAREVAAKLYEIVLFIVLFLLLLQVVGISLTALAVFGGALGLGIGLGMQRIAANFISGIIILMDRSLTLDDYVELEDGRAGRIRELNMRSATLETFDGKDIVVPNETFVSTAFTNWTHNNAKQRYELEFSVAYSTDLPPMLDLVAELVGSHPQVFSGADIAEEERPSVEIKSFGDSAINIEVEFWMKGIDDGPNDVRADLRLMIWSALREHNIEMPFPQREVTILSGGSQ